MKVIKKPWGKEEILEINNKYMMKKLFMLKGHRCSLQYHRIKRETIFVLRGRLCIYCGPSVQQMSSRIFKQNETITIAPRMIHRMEALRDTVYLEASTPEMDDVVRLTDDYRRVTVAK